MRARKAAAAAGTIPPLLDRNWLEQLYVDPDLTGQGVGSTLLALAKRERPDGLRLWTFVSNLGARRFYVRHGFREVERTDGARNEEHAPDILYEWHAASDRGSATRAALSAFNPLGPQAELEPS